MWMYETRREDMFSPTARKTPPNSWYGITCYTYLLSSCIDRHLQEDGNYRTCHFERHACKRRTYPYEKGS